MVAGALVFLCLIPTQGIFPSQDTVVNASSHPILRKHRAAGFRASFCNWEMMMRLAVQVELKVKGWDQHLAVCVGKGVQDCCQQCERKT